MAVLLELLVLSVLPPLPASRVLLSLRVWSVRQELAGAAGESPPGEQ